ncbi:MAG: hypothetical protein Q7K34_02685 [archaeon]|nr:hypothetical protein [archaeon]
MDFGYVAFRLFFFLFAVSFLLPHAAAVAPHEAANFVVKENNYLLQGEEYEQPVVPISNAGKKFWVVPVISGGNVVTFFPVQFEVLVVSTSAPVNREVFKTADLLRELSIEKESISKNPSVEWVFTPTYALRFSNLSNVLANERFQLTTVASTVDSQEAYSVVEKLNVLLEGLSVSAQKTSQLVSAASKAESDFFSEPDTSMFGALKESFDSVGNEIGLLNSTALDYRRDLERLKQIVSVSGLDPSTKTYLVSLADVPVEFNSIGNYKVYSLEVSESINSVYARVSQRTDPLLEEFASRLERQKAFDEIYGQNADVKEKTGNRFSTASELVLFVLAQENRSKWNSSSLVERVEDNWRQAMLLYNGEKYSLAVSFSKKAFVDSLNVYNGGFFKPPVQSEDYSGLIFQVIIALVVLLVLLVAYNNRDKLLSFSKQNDDSGEY